MLFFRPPIALANGGGGPGGASPRRRMMGSRSGSDYQLNGGDQQDDFYNATDGESKSDVAAVPATR